jgi:hypothetical protein
MLPVMAALLGPIYAYKYVATPAFLASETLDSGL